jgi:hypothetical protein
MLYIPMKTEDTATTIVLLLELLLLELLLKRMRIVFDLLKTLAFVNLVFKRVSQLRRLLTTTLLLSRVPNIRVHENEKCLGKRRKKRGHLCLPL